MLKSDRDPTQRYKVIIEKRTYAGDEIHSSSVPLHTIESNGVYVVTHLHTIKANGVQVVAYLHKVQIY